VWDLLFAESISLGLIDMTCIAMLLRIHWDLMEADYSTALTLLLRYSLPRSSPNKPVSLVKDAFYLDQNRTPQAGAKLILHYSGKSPDPRDKKGGKKSRNSTDLSMHRPHTPGSQNHNKPVPRPVEVSSPGRPSAARFLPQQKGLESLFQEVSGNLQKRTEGWNLSKTIQGAVNEVKRNMNNSLAASPQIPRVSYLSAENPIKQIGEGSPDDESFLRRIHELEQRNKALAKMLDGALESLRSVKFNEPEAKAAVEATFNISLAKIQFVSVYLSDPEIPIPPEEPATSHVEAPNVAEKQILGTGDQVVAAEFEQPTEVPVAAPVPNTKVDPAPGRKPLAQLTPQHQPRRQQRPSLAESSFSFMLGEGRHRSSFVSGVADLPEQTRVEQSRQAESKSRVKTVAAESKKEQQRERRGSESEDDGFTLTSLQGVTGDA
jgi:TBC1 domain family protein 5